MIVRILKIGVKFKCIPDKLFKYNKFPKFYQENATIEIIVSGNIKKYRLGRLQSYYDEDYQEVFYVNASEVKNE